MRGATLLPGLAAGKRFCTVLYTEPGAGSDLAALETQATSVAEGGWRISGPADHSTRRMVVVLAGAELLVIPSDPDADPGNIAAFAQRVRTALKRLVGHCAMQDPVYRPGDFPGAGLDDAALARLLARFGAIPSPPPSPAGGTRASPEPAPAGGTGLSPEPAPAGGTGLSPPAPAGGTGPSPLSAPAGGTRPARARGAP